MDSWVKAGFILGTRLISFQVQARSQHQCTQLSTNTHTFIIQARSHTYIHTYAVCRKIADTDSTQTQPQKPIHTQTLKHSHKHTHTQPNIHTYRITSAFHHHPHRCPSKCQHQKEGQHFEKRVLVHSNILLLIHLHINIFKTL